MRRKRERKEREEGSGGKREEELKKRGKAWRVREKGVKREGNRAKMRGNASTGGSWKMREEEGHWKRSERQRRDRMKEEEWEWEKKSYRQDVGKLREERERKWR